MAETETKPPTHDLTRRDVMKLGAAAAIAVSIGTDHASAQTRTFLTREELAFLDELTELIIPTDEHSPGARAAKVAAFIDGRLAEAWTDEERTAWRDGLRSLDMRSQEIVGLPFMQASRDQRVAVLTRVAQNERNPQTADERFFVELKSRTIDAYYSSEIGIKQEMEYKGNVPLAEFVGTDVS
jgi:hypothetical protein